MTRSLGLVSLLLTTLASSLDAQQHPNVARGASSAASLSVGEIDAVNVFNGNLSLSIPLGQTYPAGGDLSYSLALHYDSNVWELEQRVEPGGGSAVEAIPLNTNAGFGWRLSLGSLGFGTQNWRYNAPDGSEHLFYATMHEGESASAAYRYTRDGTYLRLHCLAASCSSAVAATVEFPDGSIHSFNAAGQLTRIEDRKGNYLAIDPTTNPNRWNLSDRFGRQHYLNFTTLDGKKVVTSVDFQAFNGARAVWTLSYQARTICRSGVDDWGQNSDTVSVLFLTQVDGPSGSGSWKMTESGGAPAYFDGGGQCAYGSFPKTGVIKSVELPTRGKVSWDYQWWSFPTAGLLAGASMNLGVMSRTVSDPFGATGTWTYAAETPANPDEVRRLVTNPVDNSKVRHYFATPTLMDDSAWTGWEYGLPYTKAQTLGSTGLYKSQDIMDSGGNLQRSVWVSYSHDVLPLVADPEYQRFFDRWYNTNRRLVTQRTKLDEDGANRYVEVSNSRFDGLGHYRDATTTGYFTSTQSRADRTEFNPASCYEVNLTTNQNTCSFTPPATGSDWILGTFTYRRQTEGSTAQQEFTFDGDGQVSCIRTLRAGSTRSSSDVLAVFDRDALGQVTAEKYYGGDTQALGTGAGCGAPATPTYRIDHGYASGARSSSQYRRPNGTLMPFASYQATIDVSTGLPSAEWDSSGFKTNYEYDMLGRRTLSEPIGNATADRTARTYISYTPAGGGSNGHAKVSYSINCPQAATGCTSPITEHETRFDGFGRAVIERTKRENGTWARRETSYNARGWKTGESGWGAEGSTLPWTTYSQFDIHGRPGKVTPPDGSTHQVTFSYSGLREVTRFSQVSDSLGGSSAENSYYTTETFDPFGRLIRVQQQLDAAFTQSTSYGYDVGNRLVSVDQTGKNAGSTVHQYRSFSYDNRGFLLSESHPEKGGAVQYQDIDARGHATKVLDGSASFATWRSYDAAERLVEMREDGASGRLLKRYTYDSGAGYGGGKVGQAVSWTHIWTGADTTVEVRETYEYTGKGGLPSARATNVYINGGNTDNFLQYFAWNHLGDLSSEAYPSWNYGPSREMVAWYGYGNGYLNAVTTTRLGSSKYYATGIGYHDNLMLASVAHANGVTDSVTKDSSGIARPGSISTSGVNSGLNFSSGSFSYDGSGNIKAIGSDQYRYDAASRLVESRLSVSGLTRTQSYAYDSYGNITSITTNGVTRNTPTTYSTNRLSSGVYDAAGNLTSLNGTNYKYDRLNRMVRTNHPGVSLPEDWLFAYTADDERIVAFCLNGESINQFRWMLRNLDGKVIREFRGGSSTPDVYYDYAYRGDQLLAAEVRNAGGGYDTRHYTLDHLGTPRLVTDDAKSRVAEYEYYPYGEAATAALPVGYLRFTGHERDTMAEGGSSPSADDLDYMHARFFNPVPGRFQSFDPVGGNSRAPQSWNRFAYVLGNPLKFVDPLGLKECEVPTCTVTDNGWDVEGAGWGVNQFLWEGYLRRSGSVETGFRLYREGDFGGFRGSGYKLGQLIPMAQSGNEWAQLLLGYDSGEIGALREVVGPQGLLAAGLAGGLIRGLASEGSSLTVAQAREILSAWSPGTFSSRAASIRYHYAKHGAGQGVLQFTRDARALFGSTSGSAHVLRTGELGIKITTATEFGIFTQGGRIVTYGPR